MIQHPQYGEASPAPDVVAVVLAGGMSRRMQIDPLPARHHEGFEANVREASQDVDKALMECAGKPLIEWTLERLRPQVRQVLLSCNRHVEAYSRWGLPMLQDEIPGFAGPLAGAHAALQWMRTHDEPAAEGSWLLTVPCDSPLLPENLAQSMRAAAGDDCGIVVASGPESEQHAFLLIRSNLFDQLDQYLRRGLRKISQFYQSLNYKTCIFHQKNAFLNINTPEDLNLAASLLQSPYLDFDGLLREIVTKDAIAIDRLNHSLSMHLRPLERRQWRRLADLTGHLLPDALFAPHDVPSYRNSAMDGFAFRYSDLVARVDAAQADPCFQSHGYPIGATILAGQVYPAGPQPQAQALRVMTGAALPDEFDVVVPQELCRVSEHRVWIPAKLRRGQNVRLVGEDLHAGDVVIQGGTRLTPIHLGLMASLGLNGASVLGPLRVGLLSTGDELLDPMQARAGGNGYVYDSNRYMLRGLLARWPTIMILDAGVVRDDPSKLEIALRKLGEAADLILSSGGVSVGEADFTRVVISKLGQVHDCHVAMKPGRRIALGRVGQALYFGLPGNPVAAAMTFWTVVRPAIEVLLGQSPQVWPLKRAIAGHRIEKKPGRTEFHRGLVELDEQERGHFFASSDQGSGILSSLSKNTCIAVLEQDRGDLQQGDSLQYTRIEELI